MLATSKNVLFPGHNHLLTASTDDPTLWLSPWHSGDNQSVLSSVLAVSRWLWPGNRNARAIIKVSGHQYWLWPRNRSLLEVAIAWWLPRVRIQIQIQVIYYSDQPVHIQYNHLHSHRTCRPSPLGLLVIVYTGIGNAPACSVFQFKIALSVLHITLRVTCHSYRFLNN